MAEPAADPSPDVDQELFKACEDGDIETVKRLLTEQDGDPTFAEPTEGKTPLMAAAEGGHEEIVQILLEAGAPWHAQDHGGYTAGEYASGSSKRVLQILLDWAVRAEMILGIISSRDRHTAADQTTGAASVVVPNQDYLNSSVEYTEDGEKLIDAEGEGVMMEWERKLMERHAAIICPQPGQGDVLNVGFGLGIIDGYLQQRKPKTHTIIEAHPDVYKRMIALGWDKIPGVTLVFGRWQDVIGDLGPFDGIFFDTYGEYYEDMKDFHGYLPHILRSGGIYSFFNGLAPDNIFFHLVYGEIARLELGRLGMEVTYEPVKIDASADKVWEGVKNRYWYLPVYFLPTCIMGEVEIIEVEEKEEERKEEAGGDS